MRSSRHISKMIYRSVRSVFDKDIHYARSMNSKSSFTVKAGMPRHRTKQKMRLSPVHNWSVTSNTLSVDGSIRSNPLSLRSGPSMRERLRTSSQVKHASSGRFGRSTRHYDISSDKKSTLSPKQRVPASVPPIRLTSRRVTRRFGIIRTRQNSFRKPLLSYRKHLSGHSHR